MRLLQLEVDQFHKLRNLKINFDDNEKKDSGSSIVFLLGENGSGKTSIFEAITAIFASFISPSLEDEYSFNYKIKYRLNDSIIELRKTNNESYVCMNGDMKEEFNEFKKYRDFVLEHKNEYLPKKIVTSYSGINDKLERIHKKVNANYKRSLTKTSKSENEILTIDKLEKMFVHSNDKEICLYLPSIWLNDEKSKEIIKETCGINKVTRIVITLDLTSDNVSKILSGDDLKRYKKEKDIELPLKYDSENTDIKVINDHRFYIFSEGVMTSKNYVEKCNSLLKEEFAKYVSDCTSVISLYSKNSSKSNAIAIEIEYDKISLSGHKLFDLLISLKAKYQANINVYLEKNGTEIPFEDLSEGEYQVIKTLGMLVLTKNVSGLVLLDEPDVHLNPNWKYRFKEMMDKLLDNIENTQVLVSTHDPLIVNGSRAQEVRIIESRDQTYAEIPFQDAIGMGIDGLLYSGYFNLPTTLDYETSALFDQRQELYLEYLNRIALKQDSGPEFEKIKKQLKKMNKKISESTVANFSLYDKEYETYLVELIKAGNDIDFTKVDQNELDSRKSILRKMLLGEK